MNGSSARHHSHLRRYWQGTLGADKLVQPLPTSRFLLPPLLAALLCRILVGVLDGIAVLLQVALDVEQAQACTQESKKGMRYLGLQKEMCCRNGDAGDMLPEGPARAVSGPRLPLCQGNE